MIIHIPIRIIATVHHSRPAIAVLTHYRGEDEGVYRAGFYASLYWSDTYEELEGVTPYDGPHWHEAQIEWYRLTQDEYPPSQLDFFKGVALSAEFRAKGWGVEVEA